jgi:hypothetical protein
MQQDTFGDMSLYSTAHSACASRRTFLTSVCLAPLCIGNSGSAMRGAKRNLLPTRYKTAERKRAVAGAIRWLDAKPETITSYPARRTPGDKYAYYSEGDYWWPDPVNPGGPYIRRDGLSNPDRSDDHRQALIRLSRIVPALVAGWIANGNRRFATATKAHLLAWFANPDTRMAPHLEHAQAIIGVNKGRGTGIIDTLHLTEVALAAQKLLAQNGLFTAQEERAVRGWFQDYSRWMTTSVNGLDEGDEVNNHGSCYVLQIAAFAGIAGTNPDKELAWCRMRFRQLIDVQIAADGKQPLELARTKPFGYCLFNLDVLSACAHLLSTATDDLWRYRNANGGSLKLALNYMAPFIADKSRWPHAKDVSYWGNWPVRHPALLFGGHALGQMENLVLWNRLNADPDIPEIIRNFPVRQPLLWQ